MGQLMKMLIEYTQLECGCPKAIFESSHDQYTPTILTNNWVTEIWAYLELCNAELDISGLWKTLPQRTSDEAIMKLATSSGLFTAPEMRELNQCRLYLQVFFVSDVVDVGGVHVEAWATKGRRGDTRMSKRE
jgi:hypothetical protein